MPVVSITIIHHTQGYSAYCYDCLDWHKTFTLKRNAEDAMLAHRMLQHGYVNSEVIWFK